MYLCQTKNSTKKKKEEKKEEEAEEIWANNAMYLNINTIAWVWKPVIIAINCVGYLLFAHTA